MNTDTTRYAVGHCGELLGEIVEAQSWWPIHVASALMFKIMFICFLRRPYCVSNPVSMSRFMPRFACLLGALAEERLRPRCCKFRDPGSKFGLSLLSGGRSGPRDVRQTFVSHFFRNHFLFLFDNITEILQNLTGHFPVIILLPNIAKNDITLNPI